MKIKHIKFSVEQIEEAVDEDETEQPEGESTIKE